MARVNVHLHVGFYISHLTVPEAKDVVVTLEKPTISNLVPRDSGNEVEQYRAFLSQPGSA